MTEKKMLSVREDVLCGELDAIQRNVDEVGIDAQKIFNALFEYDEENDEYRMRSNIDDMNVMHLLSDIRSRALHIADHATFLDPR